jgi:hypothetical protein
MLVLTGYMDESYDSKVFSLSCVFTSGGHWWYLANDWQKVIDKKNQSLDRAGRKPISRYHASDCSTRNGEFRDWSIPECVEFAKELFDVLRKYPLNNVGFSLALAELKEEIPEAAKHEAAFGYAIMLKYALREIGNFVATRQKKGTKITLFHDRCDYGAVILQSFQSMLKRQDFGFSKQFTTIASIGWEECVPLQPTDLIAYENFKESERHYAGRKRRRSLDAILSMKQFGGSLTHLDRDTLRKLKANIDRDKLTKGTIDVMQ